MNTARFVAIGLLTLLVLAGSRGLGADNRTWYAIATESDGTEWVIHRKRFNPMTMRAGEGPFIDESELFRKCGAESVPVKVQATTGLQPVQLHTLRDGSVACVWIGTPPQKAPMAAVSVHRGDAIVSVATVPGKFPDDARFYERGDRSFILSARRQIAIMPRSGEGTSAPAMASLLDPPGPEDQFIGLDEPPRLVEDGAGGLWFWTNSLSPLLPSYREWRGFRRVVDGKTQRAEINGLPANPRITAVLPRDADHAWVAILDEGIWVVDWRARRAEPLPDAKGGPRRVVALFACGANLYSVTGIGTQSRPLPPGSPHDAEPETLYRFTEQGWVKVVEDFQMTEWFNGQPGPWPIKEGLLVQRGMDGLWLLSADPRREPVLLDWRRGLPQGQIRSVAQSASGGVTAITSEGEALQFDPAAPPPVQPTRFQPFSFRTSLVRDASGSLWGIDERWQLVRWDGARWEVQPTPRPIEPRAYSVLLLADKLGRGWLSTGAGWVAVGDLVTGRWEVYESWEPAIVAQASQALPRAEIHDPWFALNRSAKGEIAFWVWPGDVKYYSGTEWQTWLRREFTEESTAQLAPYFTEAGDFRVTVGPCLTGTSHFLWEPELRAWRKSSAGQEPASLRLRQIGENPKFDLDPTTPEGFQASPALDETGVTWASAQTRAFRVVPERAVPVFDPGEVTPWRPGSRILQVFIDQRGGAFVAFDESASSGRRVYYHVAARFPVPAPGVQMVRLRADEALLKLSAAGVEASAETWFRWKLDDFDWVPAQRESDVLLQGLSNGAHRLQVRAYNAELATTIARAQIDWKCDYLDEVALARLVGLLGSRTLDDRRAAAAELRGQSTAAFPYLRAARETAPAEAQFWIEKVIGEIEADTKAK